MQTFSIERKQQSPLHMLLKLIITYNQHQLCDKLVLLDSEHRLQILQQPRTTVMARSTAPQDGIGKTDHRQ